MADLESTHEESETRCQGFRKDSLQLEVRPSLSCSPEPLTGPDASAELVLSDAAAALQETVDKLEAEHTRLAKSLAAINAENARLATVQEEADLAARLFRELAEQSSAQGQDPTNRPSTIRQLGTWQRIASVAPAWKRLLAE